jgi:hypothetical protein
MDAPNGTFIMYSAGAGQTALDRLPPPIADPDPVDSVFTRKLLPLLRQKGIEITELAREVRKQVHALAATVSHAQTPAYYDGVLGKFCLAGCDADDGHPQSQLPTEQETKNRVYAAGGSHGKLDITLSWNGHADLDLHVRCPGGALSYKRDEKHACSGGEFQIDQNHGEVVNNPVEHISWASEPPPGPYRVEVQLYDYNDAPAGPVPFTVVITDGGISRTYTGTVKKGESVKAAEFQR